jgi:high frequency lysogenization protein
MNQIDDLTDYQSLALAGVVQAAELVHAAAHGRQQDPAAAEAVKRAITSQHAGSLREVFPEIGSFRMGARSAAQSLEGNPREPEVLRYTLQLIELAALLHRSPDVVQLLGRELDALPADPTNAELARVYQASISTLGKRIQVTGNPDVLQRESVASEIRALLLGGVRFAWLWQQLGGRRWHLVLKRKALHRAMTALATILDTTVH